MFILVQLRDAVTATAKVQLARSYGGNCYLYQAQGVYNTSTLDIVFCVTTMRRMLHHLHNRLESSLKNELKVAYLGLKVFAW